MAQVDELELEIAAATIVADRFFQEVIVANRMLGDLVGVDVQDLEISVQKTANQTNDASVDLGMLELKPIKLPTASDANATPTNSKSKPD